MTNEKAIMCLEDMKIKVPIPKAAKQARENNEALDVAIKALAESEHSTNLAEVGTNCSEFPNKLQKLADEIASFKQCVKSDNSDYLTGYLCALSVVEGMIADMREDCEKE